MSLLNNPICVSKDQQLHAFKTSLQLFNNEQQKIEISYLSYLHCSLLFLWCGVEKLAASILNFLFHLWKYKAKISVLRP